MKRAASVGLAVALFFGGVALKGACRGAVHAAARTASVQPAKAAIPPAEWAATPVENAEFERRIQTGRVVDRFSEYHVGGGKWCWLNSADEQICETRGLR